MDIVENEPIPHHGACWGHWRFDARYGQPSIDFIGGGYKNNPYWIALSRIKTPANLAFWKQHLGDKAWFGGYVGTERANRADFLTAVKTLQRLGYVYRGRHYTVAAGKG
jgi:hypothetical protein